jgi:hypothetical protein
MSLPLDSIDSCPRWNEGHDPSDDIDEGVRWVILVFPRTP